MAVLGEWGERLGARIGEISASIHFLTRLPMLRHETGAGTNLAQAAWASAGVQIPRDSYEQFAALPHVPLASIEPGDILVYNGEGHVAVYVGGGYIIDAPQTGLDVEKIPMSTPWYAGNLDGVLRP